MIGIGCNADYFWNRRKDVSGETDANRTEVAGIAPDLNLSVKSCGEGRNEVVDVIREVGVRSYCNLSRRSGWLYPDVPGIYV